MMGKRSQAVGQILAGGGKAFSRFPAAMASAFIVAACSSALIHLVRPEPERILGSLTLAFGMAFFWGMTAAVAGDSFRPRFFPFLTFNLLTILGAGGLFFYLDRIRISGDLPAIVLARLAAAGLLAFLLFLLVIAADKRRSDFNQSVFLVLKALMIALLYGLVIMLGLMFVAFTVENLILDNLNEKVYAHIAIWSGFMGIAFFLGYLPRFCRDKPDSGLEKAQQHPAFIEILFTYVMIPIMLVLTLVLSIWAVRILVVGDWQEFGLLTAIFSAYTLFGIFISMMVIHYQQRPAGFFVRFFPISALIFLAFEGYAIYRQISENGIRATEYFVILIWLLSLFAVIILLFRRPPATRMIAVFAAVLTILAVLPGSGYQSVSVLSQSKRLQAVLIKNDMIVEGKIHPAPPSISLLDRITITDAAELLMQDDHASVRKAPWLENSLASTDSFHDLFGFHPTFSDFTPDDRIYEVVNLGLSGGAVDISDYSFSILSDRGFDNPLSINGTGGRYDIRFLDMRGTGTPTVRITHNGQTVLSQSLQPFVEALAARYEQSAGKSRQAAAEVMSLELEQGDVKILIVFQNVSIQIGSDGKKSASLYPAALYFAADG